MSLKIMDYDGESYDTNIPIETVEDVTVTIVSGDEILAIELNDGSSVILDVSTINRNWRYANYYDGTYMVSKEELLKWNNRKDSYEWLWEEM